MQRIPQRKKGVIEQDLVLLGATDEIEHQVSLLLVQHDLVIVEDDVARLFRRLL